MMRGKRAQLWTPPKPSIIRPGLWLPKKPCTKGMLLATQYVGLAAGAAGSTISFVTSTDAQSNTITVPSSVVAGDILVLVDRATVAGGTPPTTVVPTGFTSINDSTATDGADADRQIFSYKLAVGTEASTVLTGMNATTESKLLLVFRGSPTILSVSLNDTDGDLDNGTSPPADQTITASGGTASLVALAAFGQWPGGAGKAVFNEILTPADDTISDGVEIVTMAYHIQNGGGSTNPVASMSGSTGFFQGIQTCYIMQTS